MLCGTCNVHFTFLAYLIEFALSFYSRSLVFCTFRSFLTCEHVSLFLLITFTQLFGELDNEKVPSGKIKFVYTVDSKP
jgi:hypothetical protein